MDRSCDLICFTSFDSGVSVVSGVGVDSRSYSSSDSGMQLRSGDVSKSRADSRLFRDD